MTAYIEIFVPELRNKIKMERKKANITQQELSLRSGVSKMTISRIERGVNNPEIETLWRILNAIYGEKSNGVILSFDSIAGAK